MPRLADSNHELTILVRVGSATALRGNRSLRIIDAPRATANPIIRYVYQHKCIPSLVKKVGAQVVFVPGGLTGLSQCHNPRPRLVVLFRNMLPFSPYEISRYSLFHYPALRFRLLMLSRGLIKSIRTADRVIFVSQHSLGCLGKYVNGARQRVIPHGISRGNRESRENRVGLLARYGIVQPYLLYLSIMDPYKHQLEILDAFQRLVLENRTAGCQLVLAGPRNGAYAQAVLRAAARLGSKVVCTGPIEREDVPCLMRMAQVLLFASTCEACPNVLLEYLNAGRPIVCSNSPPMPEFGQDAVRYVQAESPTDWALAIDEILSNSSMMDDLASRAESRAAWFSWDNTARRTLSALTEW